MTPETLAEALAATCAQWPDRTAVVYGQQRLTYGRLWYAITTLATKYRRLGIGRGDRIVCAVSNRPETIIALGAAWRCGAVHVGVDYQFTAPELTYVVGLTQASAAIFQTSDIPKQGGSLNRALRDTYPATYRIAVGDYPTPSNCLVFSTLLKPGGEAFDAEATAPQAPTPQDPCMIFISSGTTGKPKATLGYHGNLCQRWQRLGGWLRFSPNDVHLAQLPLTHGFGLMMAVTALLKGGCLVLLDQFSAAEALDVVSRERVTVLNGAPAHFKLLLQRLDPTRHDVSSLRLSVGTAAAFPPPLLQSIWDKLGVEFMFMYGSSEGVGVATTDRDDMLRGSVGRPTPGAVAIVDADRQPLPVGAIGEIAFSRQVYPVRYWKAAGATAETDSEPTWYYSGDLGRLDEVGRLYVYGRLKHQIDRGGLKVDPVEVEAALSRCPEVADAAVIGLPNPILGEIVGACVVPAHNAALTLEQLRAALSSELAAYKLPEALHVVDAIPRTPIGKVDLARLRDEIAAMPQRPLPVAVGL